MMPSCQVIEEESKYILQTYGRAPIVLTHGSGARVWDSDGKEYVDMAAGIAVNALGHSDKRWEATLVDQAGRLSHTSNLYHTSAQVRMDWGGRMHTLAWCTSGQVRACIL